MPEGLTDMKRFLSGGGTRGFLVLMLYASLDRLCQLGTKRKPARPLINAGAASVTPSNNFKSIHMFQLMRHSRFNGTKGRGGASKRVTLRYFHGAGLYQFACRGYVWGPVGGGPEVKKPLYAPYSCTF